MLFDYFFNYRIQKRINYMYRIYHCVYCIIIEFKTYLLLSYFEAKQTKLTRLLFV